MLELPQLTVKASVTAAREWTVFSYNLANMGNTALGEFALAIPAGASLRGLSAPPGWLALYVPAEGRLVWQSAALPTDLAPGETLDGFRFQAAARVGPASYQVRHFAADGRVAGHGGGVTLAPAASSDALTAPHRSKMYRFSADSAFRPAAGYHVAVTPLVHFFLHSLP